MSPRDAIVEDLYPELWVIRLFAKRDDEATPVTSLTGSSYLTSPRSGGYEASPRNQAGLLGLPHVTQPEVGGFSPIPQVPQSGCHTGYVGYGDPKPWFSRAVGLHGGSNYCLEVPARER